MTLDIKLQHNRLLSRVVAVVSASLLLAPLLTACGSSKSTSTPATSGTTAVAATSQTTSGGGPATASPIDIQMPNLQGSTEGLNLPEAAAAANAAVQWVNAHGGVNGHPLKLKICDLLTTPASDIACANSMAAASPVAVVGGAVDNENPIITSLAAADIPFVTTSPSAAETFTSPDSFDFGPGNNGSYNLVAAHEAANGGKNVSLVLISAPGALAEVKAAATPSFSAHGVNVNVLLTSPLGQPDMAPTIQAATKSASGVYLDEDPTTCIAGFNARATLQVSSAIRFYADYSCETPAVIKASNGNANGVFFATVDDASNPNDLDYATYTSAMKQYAPSTFTLGFAGVGFAGVMDLVRVMQTISPSTPITAASVKAALQSAHQVKAFLGNGSTFTCNGTAVKGEPSVCGGSYYLDQYTNGQYKYVESATIGS